MGRKNFNIGLSNDPGVECLLIYPLGMEDWKRQRNMRIISPKVGRVCLLLVGYNEDNSEKIKS